MPSPETRPASDAEVLRFHSEAVRVTREAGTRAMRAFRGEIALEFKGKKQDDPVTVIDREIEGFLRTELQAAFPEHGFVGEEQADTLTATTRFVWVMDPIDGTANFASGLPIWGVSLACLCNGVPIVGCIWTPMGPAVSPGLYHAWRGGGARFDDTALHMDDHEDLRGRIFALPAQAWRRFRLRQPKDGSPTRLRALSDPRSLGSITAEMVLVASGALLGAVFVQPKIWDVAAGGLIVQEAGGQALTWDRDTWQHVARYEPVAAPKGGDPPALRNWSRPLIVGAPSVAEQIASRLVWHPRLPLALRRTLGLD